MTVMSRRLLAPAVALMRAMSMPAKLALLTLLVLVPLLLLIGLRATGKLEETRKLAREREAAAAVEALAGVVTQLQTHRGLTNRVLAGDAAAQGPRDATRARLGAALSTAEERLGAMPAGLVPTDAAAWRATVRTIAEGRHATQREEAFAEHTRAVERTRRLLVAVADQGGLMHDGEAATAYLIDIAVERLVPLTESLGLVRGQGAGVLARGDASSRERTQLLGRAEAVTRYLDEVATRVDALARVGGSAPATWKDARTAAERFAARAIETFNAEALPADTAGAFFDEGTAAIQAVVKVQEQVGTALRERIDARASAHRLAMTVELAVAGVGFALLAWLAAAFYISFRSALTALHQGMQAVASGDLAHRVDIPGRDELAGIGRLVEQMNERLSAMVAEIRSSAARVGMAGHQVSEGSAALSQRTEEQAASLRQTLATVQALSEAVAENAAAAGELDRLTGGLRTRAEAGGDAMRQTVDAMSQLETSSRRVGEIVGVIDGIAFQTNILALNAAVEAARAGEAGRGFAVVAAEVRQLAQRSSAAAGEIRQLIQQSGQQVEGSVAHIQNVGGVLESLVSGVRTASDSLRAIAAASARQSADLEQVSASVGNLDEITRRNAEMVTESAGASQDLVSRAAALSDAVASIRLRQGSADEARALVERAMPLLHSRGIRGAAEELHSKAAGFVDRDLYVFVIDRVGRYIVHGAKPEMEGKRVHEVPGIDGDRFLRDAWAAAEHGSGWIDYDIVNPGTGAVQPKTSYVVRLDDEHFVGCGVYRRGDTAAATAPAPAATRRAAPRGGAGAGLVPA